MSNVVLINASPKMSNESVSKSLVDMLVKHIDAAEIRKAYINVRQSLSKNKAPEDFESLLKADAAVIVFPLYVFCMPGILTRFLEDYYKYYLEHRKSACRTKFYAIVNCGFPEPEINLEAVRVIKSFCRHINAHFRFGILIGGGGMLLGAGNAPFMKKTLRSLDDAFSTIAKDIQSDDIVNIDNISIRMNFPRRLYMFMGDRGWISAARKNGLQKKDLYRRPYI